MPRIRTVKPEFFRHELLQELEQMHPGKYVMLVFEGLWTQCDNQGIFPDRPRMLKLDILPFLDFDLNDTLEILRQAGLIERYEVGGEQYGQVITFNEHQRLTGKEAGDEGRKYPGNNGETVVKQQGSTQLPRKGKERKRKGKEYTSGFEKFWTEYPRKEGKGKAAEIWNRDGLDSQTDWIVESVKAYRNTEQWKKEGGQFIPHPSTFLNQKRYDDEPKVQSSGRNLGA